MAVAIVQTATKGGTASSTTISLTLGATTTGNLLVIAIQNFDTSGVSDAAAISSVTDSASNAWSQAFTLLDAAASARGRVSLFYARNPTGGSAPTITVTFASAQGAAIVVREYSGISTSSFVDKTASQAQTTTAASSGATATTASANELIIGATGYKGATTTVTPGSGYANQANVRYTGAGAGSEIFIEDKTVSATGAQTATFTLAASKSIGTGVGTFVATAAVTPTNNFLQMF